jgi:hypothetical protein
MSEPKPIKIVYGISLGDNSYYEENLEGELLVFDNLQQISDYATVNDIPFEDIVVHEFEVVNEDDIPEVEF